MDWKDKTKSYLLVLSIVTVAPYVLLDMEDYLLMIKFVATTIDIFMGVL